VEPTTKAAGSRAKDPFGSDGSVGTAVANNLWLALQERQQSDAAFERAAGLGERYLARLRSSTRDPAYTVVRQIARTATLSIEQLLVGYVPLPVVVMPVAYHLMQHGLKPTYAHLLSAVADQLAYQSDLVALDQPPTISKAAARAGTAGVAVYGQQVVLAQGRPAKLPASLVQAAEDLRALVVTLAANLLAVGIEQRLVSSEFEQWLRVFRTLTAADQQNVRQVTTALQLAETRAEPGNLRAAVNSKVGQLVATVEHLLGRSERRKAAAAQPLAVQPGGGELPFAQAVAVRVEYLRRRLAVSDVTIEREARLGSSYLSVLRAGKLRDPSYSRLYQLATVCGVTLDYLAEGGPLRYPRLVAAEFYARRFGLLEPAYVDALEQIAVAFAKATTTSSLWDEVTTSHAAAAEDADHSLAELRDSYIHLTTNRRLIYDMVVRLAGGTEAEA